MKLYTSSYLKKKLSLILTSLSAPTDVSYLAYQSYRWLTYPTFSLLVLMLVRLNEESGGDFVLSWVRLLQYPAVSVVGVCACCGYSRSVPHPREPRPRQSHIYLMFVQLCSQSRVRLRLHAGGRGDQKMRSRQKVVGHYAQVPRYFTNTFSNT